MKINRISRARNLHPKMMPFFDQDSALFNIVTVPIAALLSLLLIFLPIPIISIILICTLKDSKDVFDSNCLVFYIIGFTYSVLVFLDLGVF